MLNSPDSLTTPANIEPSRWQEFWAGARDIIPLVIGAIPFGLIFGTLAQSSGLSFWGAIGLSAIVFAGSSQFVALGLLSAGSTIPLIILTTFVVNLRHLLYSASLVPHVKRLSPLWKLAIGFWLTDENFVVAIRRYERLDPSPYKHWYYLGAACLMYGNWQLCTLVGLTLGQAIPDANRWGLDFAMIATFIGMVVPYITRSAMVATVIVAAIVALLTNSWPHKLGLIVAALAGVLAGFITDRRSANP
jgi:4-azaleucine resistance transporter AzlC